MNSQTEALMSLMLLEDTLDREVERREEELVWERRKLVYLEALGCADSEVLRNLQIVTKRSEAVIDTLKNLLHKTYQERQKFAEKVESNIQTTPPLCSTERDYFDEALLEYRGVRDTLPNLPKLKRKHMHKPKLHRTKRKHLYGGKLSKICRTGPNKRNGGSFCCNIGDILTPNAGCSGSSPKLNVLSSNMPKQLLPNTPTSPSLINQSLAQQQTCDQCSMPCERCLSCGECNKNNADCLLLVFPNKPKDSLQVNVDLHDPQQGTLKCMRETLRRVKDELVPNSNTRLYMASGNQQHQVHDHTARLNLPRPEQETSLETRVSMISLHPIDICMNRLE